MNLAPFAADVTADVTTNNQWGAVAAIGSAFLAAVGLTLSALLKRSSPKGTDGKDTKAGKGFTDLQRQLTRTARDLAYLRGSTDARFRELEHRVEAAHREAEEARRVAETRRDRLDRATH